MRNPLLVRFGLRMSVAIAVFPVLAQAHPGHDGHELTWDFGHLAAHPLATLGWIALFTVGFWGAAKLARSSSTSRIFGSRGDAEKTEA